MTEFRRYLYGYAITAKVTVLDEGIHILLSGGQKSHVGAVVNCTDGRICEFQAEHHKELEISRRWAQELSQAFHTPVTVACGIHYDGLSKEGIQEVIGCTEGMLAELIEKKSENKI